MQGDFIKIIDYDEDLNELKLTNHNYLVKLKLNLIFLGVPLQ